MRVCYALRPDTVLEEGDIDGMHAMLGSDPGETWDLGDSEVRKDGRKGRDGDGDGILNERGKRVASAVGTAALIGAGIGGGVIAGKNLKARHIKEAAKATRSAARAVSSVLPKSSTRSKVGGLIGLSVAGHLADYLTRSGAPEIGVDLSRDEANIAAKEAHSGALTAGPMGSKAYTARYDQEIARVVSHNRALGEGPIGSAAYNQRFKDEFERLDPNYRGIAERTGRAVTGSFGAVAGGAAGSVIGAGAGAVGGKLAAYLANDLTGSNLSGGLTGAAAGLVAGGYKGGQAGFRTTAPIGGVIGRGVDRIFKFDGVHVGGTGGGKRWDAAKHRRAEDGKFTFKNGGGAASVSAPNEIESRRKDDIARSVGTITGAVGGAVGGLVGGVVGSGIGSAALGFAGNIAGDYVGRELGERVTRAFMAGDSRAAYRELLMSTASETSLGESLGGVVGNLAGDQAGRTSGAGISAFLASRGGAVLGTKGKLAAGIAGSIAGEFSGKEFLAKPIDDAIEDLSARDAADTASHVPFARVRKADEDDWTLVAQISKVDDDKRMIYGWASVIEENGTMVTDRQGDEMDVEELVKAAHDFMLNARVTGEMHKKLGVGQAVESMVFTHDLQKALGVDLGRVGWFVGMKINDDNVWARVKAGELGFLSIGGRGVRKPIDVDAEMKIAAGVAT